MSWIWGLYDTNFLKFVEDSSIINMWSDFINVSYVRKVYIPYLLGMIAACRINYLKDVVLKYSFNKVD